MSFIRVNEHTVNGQIYKVWSDFDYRGTFAESPTGLIKQISQGGYISNDLTIRKAIAVQFGLPTFRK